MFNFFKFKKDKKEPQSLDEIIASLKRLETSYQEVSGALLELRQINKKNFQKIGLVRFNPFSEVGGDQSFSLALLDDSNDGVVLTSHYLRESNRVYAKPLVKGKSKYQLSKEETEAINKAINA